MAILSAFLRTSCSESNLDVMLYMLIFSFILNHYGSQVCLLQWKCHLLVFLKASHLVGGVFLPHGLKWQSLLLKISIVHLYATSSTLLPDFILDFILMTLTSD